MKNPEETASGQYEQEAQTLEEQQLEIDSQFVRQKIAERIKKESGIDLSQESFLSEDLVKIRDVLNSIFADIKDRKYGDLNVKKDVGYRSISIHMIFNAFKDANLKVINKEDGKERKVSFFGLPVDRNGLISGAESESILPLDNFSQFAVPDFEKINLKDGTHTYRKEIELARFLKKNNARRENGELVINTPGGVRAFSTSLYSKMIKREVFSIDTDGKKRQRDILELSYDELKLVYPNMFESGAMTRGDYKVILRENSLDALRDYGCIGETGEVNITLLKKLMDANKRKLSNHLINRMGATNFARGLAEINTSIDGKEKRLISLPKNKSELLSGEWSLGGVLSLEDIVGARQMRYLTFAMEDGVEIRYDEARFARKFKEFGVRRDENGYLVYPDPKTGKMKNFFYESFCNVAGLDAGFNKGVIKQKIKKLLPNLVESGLITPKDIRVFSSDMEPHARKLTLKGSANYINATNDSGFAKYYLGREKIVGLNIPIEESMVAKRMDNNKMIILAIRHGKPMPIAYFDLLSGEEMDAVRSEARKRLLSKREETVSDRRVMFNSSVNAGRMKKHIHRYEMVDFVSAKPGEPPRDYASRVQRLNEAGIDFLFDKVRPMFEDIGIKIYDLPWKEQLQIAEAVFLEKNRARMINFCEKFGVAGLKTFLSLEYGRDFGDKIIEMGEKLPEESAKQLFAKYAEIVDAANDASGELSKASKDGGKENNETLGKVKENLLKYGRKLLENFSSKLGAKDSGKELEALLEQLSQTKADIVLSAVVFKALASEGASLEDIANMSIETLRRQDISDKDRQEMARIFHANRDEYPENLRKIVAEDFYNILTNGEREFHIMKRGEDIIAFARFDELSDGNLYIGSLNVRPEIKSLTVGGAFLSHLIRQKNANHTLEAEAYSQNKMLPHYTGKFGFKIVGEIPNYHGSKHLFYKMEIPKGSQAAP